MSDEILLKQNEDGTFGSFEPYKVIYFETEEDFNKLQEALEKQIPKVATNIETHYIPESYETDYVTGNCPSCGALFADGDFEDFYCHKCGQLVSWDDE